MGSPDGNNGLIRGACSLPVHRGAMGAYSKMTLPTSQERSQNDIHLAGTSIWDFPDPRSVRNEFLLFNPPSL